MGLIPMVMVNGELYLDTGYESTMNGRCGVMDGKITSEVDGSEKPSVDNQSNFGVGYDYQYGATEGTIEIYMNGEWRIFAVEDVQQQMQSSKENIVIGSLDIWGLTFTVKDVTPYGLTFVCTQSGGELMGELQTGSRFILGKWDEENGWQEMPIKCEVAWTSEAYFIPKDETTEFEIAWEWLYGKLPAGRYIVGKEIMDFRETGDYATHICYAEFEITE